MIRRLLFAVGGVATAVGLLALAVPAAPDIGPLGLVGALLAVALVAGVLSVGRLATDRERPTPAGGDRSVTVPGDGFDDRLPSVPAYSDRGADDRVAIRERVRAVAIERLVAERGVSRAAAAEALEAGTWTDDAEAAALFTDEPPSTGAQVRSLLGGPSAFERRVDRAVAVLTEGVEDA